LCSLGTFFPVLVSWTKKNLATLARWEYFGSAFDGSRIDNKAGNKSLGHRNLKTGTSMLAQVLQIFLCKEHLVKNWLISTLDKEIHFKEQFFSGLQKPLFTSQNRVEIS
jgi:hypothetical protein